jgi:hypothetical protein
VTLEQGCQMAWHLHTKNINFKYILCSVICFRSCSANGMFCVHPYFFPFWYGLPSGKSVTFV